MRIFAAHAAVWRAGFVCVAPCVRTMSAPWSRASASRNSSLRVLLPPVDIPVQSSRLIQISGPLSALLKFGRYSSGVGRCAKRILGKRARFMFYSHLETEYELRHRHSGAVV